MSDVRPSRFLIYGLIDPRDRCLRYVGKTHKRREIRLSEHIEAAREGQSSRVYRWIRGLLKLDLVPEIFVLERVPGTDDWGEAERRNIAFWRDPKDIDFPYTHPPQTPKSKPTLIHSAKLTNIHEGGKIKESRTIACTLLGEVEYNFP